MNDTGNKVFGCYQGHLRISEPRKSNLYMQDPFFRIKISSLKFNIRT